MTRARRSGPGFVRIVPYVVSFATGVLAGVVFWLLRTPTPVPPLVGLVGLLGIAFGEIMASRAVNGLRGRSLTRARGE